jgi:hypothetical protein
VLTFQPLGEPDCSIPSSWRMKSALSVLASALLIACSTAHRPFASKIPGDRREFEIVQVDYAEGVLIRQEGADLVIELAPPAGNLLMDGGRVQFVNQYR